MMLLAVSARFIYILVSLSQALSTHYPDVDTDAELLEMIKKVYAVYDPRDCYILDSASTPPFQHTSHPYSCIPVHSLFTIFNLLRYSNVCPIVFLLSLSLPHSRPPHVSRIVQMGAVTEGTNCPGAASVTAPPGSVADQKIRYCVTTDAVAKAPCAAFEAKKRRLVSWLGRNELGKTTKKTLCMCILCESANIITSTILIRLPFLTVQLA